MSLTDLLRQRTLCVALAPGRLAAAVRSGGRVLESTARRTAFDAQDWDGALGALAACLKQADAKGLPLSVSVSTHWCRLAMVPWSDALLAESSAAPYLEMQLAAVFGPAARTWAIGCDDAPYGQPRLACGIDREFLDGIRGVALEHGQRLAGVEPVLSLAWRAIAHAKPAAFALAEPGRLVLATAARGRITGVQAQPVSGTCHAELPRAWQRWALRMPALSAIAEVALVDLDEAAPAEAPPGFRHAVMRPGAAATVGMAGG